jgi:hypothetical protein
MAIRIHNATWLLLALALASLAAVSGCCCQAVPLPGENQCPTDARRLYCSCGEEAVRRCPCGPDSEFYGLKPTCWREWPEGWHCNGCEGMPYVDRALCGDPVAEELVSAAPTVEMPATENVDISNPFRSKLGAAEFPLPPQTSQSGPTPADPAKTAPVEVVPPQPMPTPPPALKDFPKDTSPAKQSPAPSVDKSTTEKPARDATTAPIAPSKAPAIVSLAAPVTQSEAKVPNPMPTVPAAMKMTAPAPILIAPQNAPTITSAPQLDWKPVRVAVASEPVKKPAEKPPVKPVIKPVVNTTEAKPPKESTLDPTLSNRVEQHLINNLRL